MHLIIQYHMLYSELNNNYVFDIRYIGQQNTININEECRIKKKE